MGFGSSRHTFADANGDGYCYCHGYFYGHSDSYCDSNGNGNAYEHPDAELNPATYTYAKGHPAAETSSHSAASSVAADNGLVERVVLHRGRSSHRALSSTRW
jgi:hypothetical protein